MLRNTTESWGWLARALHWLIAVWIIGQFGFGLWMGEVPPKEDRVSYYTLHDSSGASLLLLMIARVLWRLVNPTPALPFDIPAWEHTAARVGHFALYVVIIATLGVGWLLASSFTPPLDVRAFGVFPMPHLITGSEETKEILEEVHEYLAFGVILLVIGHTASALAHHFIRKNHVLTRMVSG
jgi:cytochrome b561